MTLIDAAQRFGARPSAMLGIALDPLDALAFDIGCDAVMLDVEVEARRTPNGDATTTSVKKGLSPEELWDKLT